MSCQKAYKTGLLLFYSRADGTHHSALVLGEHAEAVAAFVRMIGMDVVEFLG